LEYKLGVWLAGAAALMLGSMDAGAQDAKISKVELRQCGIYSHELKERESDTASQSGKRRIVGNNRLVQETSQIPARSGVSFGCQITLHGTPKGATAGFVAVMRLPPGAPRETLRGSQSYPIGGEGGYVGYTFRGGENTVAGNWTLEIWVDEKKFASASFTMKK
jgi:hypothetical protein